MTYDLYRSGFVQRYASKPEMAWTGQTDAHHQWGVTVLLLRLFGAVVSPEAVWEALHHDTGEMGACDVSYPAKQKYPALAEAAGEAEAQERAEMGVPEAKVSYEDYQRVKFCDRLESYLFTSVRAPWLLHNAEWKAQRHWLEGESFKLNVAAEVRALLGEVGA